MAIIPFRFMPGSWGLKGKAYDEAEAYYKLSGEALERRLIEIRYVGEEAVRKNLDLDVHYGMISAYQRDFDLLAAQGAEPAAYLDLESRYGNLDTYQYDVEMAKLQVPEGKERDIKLLEVEFHHGKIELFPFEKAVANLREEPWIRIINQGLDFDRGVNGGFNVEFDWNDLWIENLRLNGYIGIRDEDMVEQWFTEVCRQAQDNPRSEQDGIFRS